MKYFNLLLSCFPFLSFFLGYILIFALTTGTTHTPGVVGLSVEEALVILSNHRLNSRVKKQVEDPSLPAGIVLNQFPSAGQTTRYQQTVLLTISKTPEPIITPLFINKSRTLILQEAQQLNIPLKIYFLESIIPEDSCIAQTPSPNTILPPHSAITIYLAKKKNNFVLMPSFKDILLSDAVLFLSNYDIIPHVINQSQHFTHGIKKIIHQKPLAGTLINLSKPITIQFLINET